MTQHLRRLRPANCLAALAAALVLWTPAAWTFQGADGTGADPRFDRLADLLSRRMTDLGVPGAALGVSLDGRSITRGFGVTSVDDPLPVTPATFFQVGSISKTFTGTLVMRLVDDGRLRLDAPIRSYIPTFRVKDETATAQATVLTTLTHMGGWEGDFFDDPGAGDEALARIVERMAGLEQIAPFNAIWSYNNAGFYVAGRLVELATGQPYEEALRELLLEPLGLSHTVVFPTDVMTRRFVVGHGGPADAPSVLRPWPLARAAHAVGGVTATIDDLLRYGEFHLGDGVAPGGARLLSASAMARMQQPVVPKHGTDDQMAITWHLTDDGGVRQVSHGGSTTGQQALLTLVPSRRLAVAVLTNSSRGSRLNRDVTRAALDEYLGVTVTDPPPVEAAGPELEAVVGRYARPFSEVIVSEKGGRLLVQAIQKQGFPTPRTPIPPPQPPSTYAFFAKDRLIAVGGPAEGARAEIIRQPDGSIGWIRVGSRVSRRVASAG